MTYVCDKMTGGWYHHEKGAGWAAASAGSGGCHTYVALKGTPPDCTVGEACAACENPESNGGTQVGNAFYLIKDGCEK